MLSEQERAIVALAVAEGLLYLHWDMSIAHLDIKVRYSSPPDPMLLPQEAGKSLHGDTECCVCWSLTSCLGIIS